VCVCVYQSSSLRAASTCGDAGAAAAEGCQPGDHESSEGLPAGQALAGVEQTQVCLSRLVDYHQHLQTISSTSSTTANTRSVGLTLSELKTTQPTGAGVVLRWGSHPT